MSIKNNFIISITFFFDRNKTIVVSLFFILHLLVGVFIYDDYAISWDEDANRMAGATNLKHIGEKFNVFPLEGTSIKRYPPIFYDSIPKLGIEGEGRLGIYGPFFEFIMIIAEYYIEFNNYREIYLFRHFATFLFFWVSMIFFYKLLKFRFNDWKICLLGTMFLVLSPRIFAHSFYNSKDLLVLAAMIIATYTLFLFLNKKSYLHAVYHGIACGILIDTRMVGMILPVLTMVFYFIEHFYYKEYKHVKSGTLLLVFLLTFLGAFYLFWPAIWENPLKSFFLAFSKNSRYIWNGIVVLWGERINGQNIPWYYIPSWILITTPILYTFGFCAACIGLFIALLRKKIGILTNAQQKFDVYNFIIFMCPLAAIILLNSTVYNGWRHMYFIYCSFLLLSISGLQYFYDFIKLYIGGQRYLSLKKSFVSILLLVSLISTTQAIVRYHPYQNVYFNFIAGKDLNFNFDGDYWGLSYLECLEFVAERHKEHTIYIFYPDQNYNPVVYNTFMLPPEIKERFIFTKNLMEADYFIAPWRGPKDKKSFEPFRPLEIYTVKRGTLELANVYSLKEHRISGSQKISADEKSLLKNTLQQYQNKNYADALQSASKLINVSDATCEYYMIRAKIYFQIQRFQNALEDCDTCLKLNPLFAIAYHNKGLIYEHLNERQQACSNYTNALKYGHKPASEKLETYCDMVFIEAP